MYDAANLSIITNLHMKYNNCKQKQQEMGLDGLAEEERYLLEINLEDLETLRENTKRIGYSQLKQQDRPFRCIASRQQGDAVGTTTDRDGICLHSRSRTKDMNLYLACKQAY